ncbi:SGNH/GDSL hydrolase family protein [Litchfieldia salsa]|uniref:Lysophospholipase L1 n=1 Tax=Litchfieldia salsa TaxID=930152 RepID=A0A1H0Q2F9_9BACI|nr:Lysophospholipase L1 [Litchfieldia salsa]
MKGKKVWIIFSSLILVSFILYLFLPVFNQPKVETVSVVEKVNDERIESQPAETIEKEEVQQEEAIIINKPVSAAIKEKVRAIIEGAIEFFSHDKKIISIGDSLTQGVGDETESGGYVGVLNHTFEENNINISIENFGKRGNRTDQLLKRLEKEEIASAIKDADIVLVTIGANDIMRVVRNNYTNLSIEPFEEERVEYVKRLKAIFTKINELNPDTEIYLIGFYNPFERFFGDIEQLEMILTNWNTAGELVTEEFENVNYIPTEDLFSDTTINLLADDNFHPNTSGYKLIAQRVLEYLNEYNEEADLPIEDSE